jgi:hypothetical protein
MAREPRIAVRFTKDGETMMRLSVLTAGALALFAAGAAYGAPFYASNAADFVVPADELDAATIGEAAVHAGFRSVPESSPKFKALHSSTDQTYAVWDLPTHKIATITLTRMRKTDRFVVLFTANDPSRNNSWLMGDACRKWLAFSNAMRSEFINGQSKYRFRNPQCTP